MKLFCERLHSCCFRTWMCGHGHPARSFPPPPPAPWPAPLPRAESLEDPGPRGGPAAVGDAVQRWPAVAGPWAAAGQDGVSAGSRARSALVNRCFWIIGLCQSFQAFCPGQGQESVPGVTFLLACLFSIPFETSSYFWKPRSVASNSSFCRM